MAPCMLSVKEVLDGRPVEYRPNKISAPRLSGISLKLFVWALESNLIGRTLLNSLKRTNRIPEILWNTIIPDAPMFYPEYAAQKVTEEETVQLDEDNHPATRVEAALKCLPVPSVTLQQKLSNDFPFLFWTIRDYVGAYKSGHTTPSEVAERFIVAVEDSEKLSPPMMFFTSFKIDDIRQQAAASTERYASGTPLSGLDGVLVAVKDDIDCYPHPSTGGSAWLHKVRDVKEDAVHVARLRRCGVVLVGKTNMHELGLGVTGNNPHHGTVRNPYDTGRYTGGSSSGSTAVVVSGLVPAALGSDVGGSIRIPSSLCGAVGLKVTVGRITLKGVSKVGWTMESLGPITATVEDALLIYSAMLGSLSSDALHSRPLPPCAPVLMDTTLSILCKLKLGKYTELFNHVSSSDILEACNKSLELLQKNFGTEVEEIVLPEQEEIRIGHVATCAGEYSTTFNPFFGPRRTEFGYESRTTMALFRSFSSSDYITAQKLRRRCMYYHDEAFKKVDIVVTPTSPMTAPIIEADSLENGQTDFTTSGQLMRFILTGNFLGLPCITVPVGHDSKGLPIGLQLMGRAWEEATLIRVASALETVCAPLRKRPKVFYNILQ